MSATFTASLTAAELAAPSLRSDYAWPMLVALLFACYDKVTIRAHVDVTSDSAVGESRTINVWQNSIACTDVPTCTTAIQGEVSNQVAALREQGALNAEGAIALHDGQLDTVMRWTFPLRAAKWRNLSFLMLYDQPAKGAIGERQRRPRATFVWQEERGTRVSVDRAPFGSRVWTLPDQPTRQGILLSGRGGDLELTFTNLDDAGNPAHSPGWIDSHLGLAAALRAVPGLVVD